MSHSDESCVGFLSGHSQKAGRPKGTCHRKRHGRCPPSRSDLLDELHPEEAQCKKIRRSLKGMFDDEPMNMLQDWWMESLNAPDNVATEADLFMQDATVNKKMAKPGPVLPSLYGNEDDESSDDDVPFGNNTHCLSRGCDDLVDTEDEDDTKMEMGMPDWALDSTDTEDFNDDDDDSDWTDDSTQLSDSWELTPHGSIPFANLNVFASNTCQNCHRKQREPTLENQQNFCHKVHLSTVWLGSGAFQRKFATLGFVEARNLLRSRCSSKCKKKRVQLTLCNQCKANLTDGKCRNRPENVWPAMVWSWLTNANLVQCHGSDLWTLIPDEWRPWWIDALKECTNQYNDISLTSPASVFSDVTEQKATFQAHINSLEGARLKLACQTMIPSVRCPWGNCEFLHQCGSLPLDLTVRRILGSHVKTIGTVLNGQLAKMEGMVPDFFDRAALGVHGGNDKWTVRPSICFVDNAPKVLTCRWHKNGLKGKCFYPPRNPDGVLPSNQQDQLTPAVVRPRTLQQTKAHKFSDSYQMSEMRGQFGGVDTMTVTSNHNFSSGSKLQRKSDSLALNERCDVKALLGDMCFRQKTVPVEVGEQMMEAASLDRHAQSTVKLCSAGATWMTLEDAVKLYRMNKENPARILQCRDEAKTVEKHFHPTWPALIVDVHPNDEHGCEFPLLPKMHPNAINSCLLWSLAAMHVAVPSIWEATDKMVRDDSKWPGWLLSHLSISCFPNRTTRPMKGEESIFRFHKNSPSTVDRQLELMLKLGLREAVQSEVVSSPVNAPANAPSVPIADDDSVVSLNFNEGNDHTVELDENDGSAVSMNIAELNENDESHAGGTLHTDGMHHPEDLHVLFRRHPTIAVVPFDHLFERTQDLWGGKSIVATVSSGGETELPPCVLRLPNHKKLELRLVSGNSIASDDHMFVLMRHGGKAFSKWWRQDSEQMQERLDQLTLLPSDMWTVAIYCEETSLSAKKCRDLMLDTLGIDNGVRCREHDLPMIAAPFRSSVARICCSSQPHAEQSCSKRIFSCCPVDGCQVALCSNHKIETAPGSARVPMTLAVPRNLAPSNGQGLDNEQNDSSSTATPMEIESLCDLDGTESLGSIDMDWVVTDVVDMSAIPDWEQDARRTCNEDDNAVPFTGNAEAPLEIRGDPTTMPGNVIFNRVGSLLARRGARTSVSSNQQHFLDKLVATAPGRSVPLFEGFFFLC